MQLKPVEFLGNFIDGRFQKPARVDGQWVKFSPCDLKERVLEVEFNYESVDEAVQSARQAFSTWSHLPQSKRFEYLRRLQEVYVAHTDQLATMIARETGKPLWESKTEVAAMINKIPITLDLSMKLVDEVKIPKALPEADGFIRFKPRGVMAVIGPFNFPGHLPNGHIVPALAAGNTVVFKPSDKTPAMGQLMAEMFQKAEFPAGVFNLVQGDGNSGRRLVGHEGIDGVLFTGSYEVGLKIKQETLNHYWKILALEMGGKNCAIVWEDADLEKAVYECLVGAFLSSGQRCAGTSKIILHPKVKDKFVENFYEAAKKLTIGHWKDNPFMGPLVSQDSVENYLRFQEIAKRDDAQSLMRGKVLDLDPQGYYVTPSINLVEKFNPDSVYQKSEIFGPNVAILTTDDFDQALEINNSSGFGLVMSVFSKDRKYYEKSLIDAHVGLVNWNRTTNGASSKLPFGGMGKSGNDRPSAHFAVYYCTVPVSSIEDETSFDKAKMMPGITYEFKG